MVDMMEERRKWKNNNSESGKRMYKKCNNKLRRITDKARGNWLNEQCREMEEMERRGRADLMYQKVRDLRKEIEPKGTRTAIDIEDKNGIILTEPEKIKARWKEHIEELYAKEHKPDDIEIEAEREVNVDRMGPNLLTDEVIKAISELKSGKATGCDEIPAEFIKSLEIEPLSDLVQLCKNIYATGKWPEDFLSTEIVAVPKKANTKKCSEHRTISLICHTSKIILKILARRLRNIAEDYLGDDQFGFRVGKGTREAIGTLRMLCEKVGDYNLEMFICYVDFEKAFDRVDWTKLMKILLDLGMDWRDRRLIKNLYMGQTAAVRIGEDTTEKCSIGRGVRQGCSLSPMLFNLYAERMVKEAMERTGKAGIKVGMRTVNAIRFADDKAIIAGSEDELQHMLSELNRVVEEFGMKINIGKTKVQRIGNKEKEEKMDVKINDKKLKEVKEFKYLGSMITSQGGCEKEIKTRIGMAKTAFERNRKLLTAKTMKWT